MPIKYTTYGCKFKCGFRHTPDYYKMYSHEKKCWYNPDVKSCRTCKHELLNTSIEAVGTNNYGRKCMINKESGETFENIRPKINCEYWEQR